mgnify:FL=1
MAKVCPKCGRTLEQFYKTSMLGCENCYKAFSAELLPVLKKMHGKTEHLGKRPRVSGVERELIYEYKRLLAEKEEAMLAGDFDAAGDMDEDIRQLSYELARRGLK